MTINVLGSIHPKVQSIISKSNRIFLEGFHDNTKLNWKKGEQLSTSVVTQTDLRLDSYLRDQIMMAFPNFGLITEEQQETLQQEYTWIIDPLDGSANFANKIPIAGISIALWRVNKPLYGIISFPLENEVIYAVRGKGAFHNGKQISYQDLGSNPHLGTLFTGVGSSEDKIRVVGAMAKEVPYPANYQSASFHFKTLVLRRADCGVFINMPIWDIAAGVVISEEAGLSTLFLSDTVSVQNVGLRKSRHTIIIANKNIASRVAQQIESVL